MNHTHPSPEPTSLDPASGPQRQSGTLRSTSGPSSENTSSWPVQTQDPYATLRSHGGRAHQLRTSLHAADHYLARGRKDERGDDPATAIWLVSCSLNLAAELSTGLHRLNKRLRAEQINPELRPAVSTMRRQACQLHAMARATAHFLAQPSRNDNEVGSWLIVTARSLAISLATDIDDQCKPPSSGGARPRQKDEKE